MFRKLDLQIINELQCLANNRKSVVEIMKYLITKLELDNKSRLVIVAYFKEAFSLELKEASQVGAWIFFEGGTWSDETIESEINHLINEQRWKN